MGKIILIGIIIFFVIMTYKEYRKYNKFMTAEDKRRKSKINLETKIIEVETVISDKCIKEMSSKINDLKGE